MAVSSPPALDRALAALAAGQNSDPFAVLGPHADERGRGTVIRAFLPAARGIDVVVRSSGDVFPMTPREPVGLYEVVVDGRDVDYRLRVTYPGDQVLEIDDPYRYGRVLTDFDLHLLGEGRHYRSFEKLGAHRIVVGSTTGVHFAVWAPNADRVSVIGDFNAWDGRVHAMRLLQPGGIWEIFIPELNDGEKYKFEIRTRSGAVLKKSDPFGLAFELPPQSAAIVRDISRYEWRDQAWMTAREARGAWFERPMTIYEVHLGSWARVPEAGNRFLTY